MAFGIRQLTLLLWSLAALCTIVIPAGAQQSVAIAHCTATGKVGLGRGATIESAIGQSVQNCIANGGETFCCRAEATAEPGQACIALAHDPTNGFYPIVGLGQSADEAANDAIIRCGVQCRVLAQACPKEAGQ